MLSTYRPDPTMATTATDTTKATDEIREYVKNKTTSPQKSIIVSMDKRFHLYLNTEYPLRALPSHSGMYSTTN